MSEAPDLDALSFKGRSGLTRILNRIISSRALDIAINTPELALMGFMKRQAVNGEMQRRHTANFVCGDF